MAISFIGFLNDLSPLSPEVVKALSACIQITDIEKHDLLIIEEDKDIRMFFLIDGYVRCFYIDEYKERTLWFRGPGELLIAGRGFYDQNGAADNIEVQKAGQVASLSYEALDAITTGYPEFEKCRRVLAEYMFKASVELNGDQ
ncbi:hypothetical protein LLH06_07895 [Mucilaginibacter daejeonensis]|uniref:Crp/Fnr family transcriptional regulator n=1 Tax=Mucilaginibacter daejeonensis TaxID=398049 RepID=UPI001D1799C1|nr:hypothetical protein [Mucilaginibacter daejeonensis]UEG54885.1 hypothetical protein LLH06_07895 [Mucilaginibacter daejeonensis]